MKQTKTNIAYLPDQKFFQDYLTFFVDETSWISKIDNLQRCLKLLKLNLSALEMFVSTIKAKLVDNFNLILLLISLKFGYLQSIYITNYLHKYCKILPKN